VNAAYTDEEGALTPDGRAHIRRLLEQELGTLGAIVDDHGGRSGTVALDQSRVGRVSRADALQQQEMAKATQRRAALRIERVEAALERLREDPDQFGWCPDCGEPIPLRRLEAVPESVLCVPCLQQRRG
jgi:DnaK suppressor protein